MPKIVIGLALACVLSAACAQEADVQEAMFRAQIAMQK